MLIPRDLCQQLLGTHFFETARLSEGIAIKHPRPSCFTPNGFSSPRSSLIAYIVSHRSIISQSRDYVSLIYISLRLRVLKEIRAEISYLCLLYLCFLLVPASFFFFCTYPPSRNRRDYVSASQLVKTTRLQRTRREISHLSSSIFFCLSSSIFFFVPTHRPQFRACHASQGETFQVLHGEKLWASH